MITCLKSKQKDGYPKYISPFFTIGSGKKHTYYVLI